MPPLAEPRIVDEPYLVTFTGSPLFQVAAAVFGGLNDLVIEHDRLTKDEHSILVAMAHALRVDCAHRLTGAVGVDGHGRFIGAGRNGTPPGRPGCRDTGSCEPEVHAAENLSYYTGALQRRGSTAALTDAPCPSCVRVMECSEWSRHVYPVNIGADSNYAVRDSTGVTVPGSAFFAHAFIALDTLRNQVVEHPRISRDEHAVLVAMAHALRADCTRRRVGAAGVDVHGRFIGAGRNGAPPRQPGCFSAGACPRGRLSTDQVARGASYAAGSVGACTAGHAEENLSFYTDPDARRGATAAITNPPCSNCAKVLASTGWARAVWPETDSDGTWTVRVLDIALAPIQGLYH